MERLYQIGDQEFRLVANAYTPLAYKNQFGRDYFQDMMNMFQGDALLKMMALSQFQKEIDVGQLDMSMLKDFDMTFFNRLFWTFVKTGDPTVKPYDNFYMDLEYFPVQDVAPVLMKMLEANMATKKPSMTANLQAMKSLQ
ncbi:hypothetical protein [Streptococcus suis]|uniref:hypothetical protein n=1 Tax=Streptococcus suis TaxID=1307 RepID=UPI003BA2FE88